ncbi:MAG: hypothetical protein RBR38_10350 [Desulfomicrobium apsheronum]|nr:hypothetical protein [Desulfomicrobium apsheronum]
MMNEIIAIADEPGHIILKGVGAADIGMDLAVAKKILSALNAAVMNPIERDGKDLDRIYIRGHISEQAYSAAKKRITRLATQTASTSQ